MPYNKSSLHKLRYSSVSYHRFREISVSPIRPQHNAFLFRDVPTVNGRALVILKNFIDFVILLYSDGVTGNGFALNSPLIFTHDGGSQVGFMATIKRELYWF